MHKTLLGIKWCLFFLLFLVFAFKASVAIDPDFGWRLRTGFEIFKNGVPRTDLYTYTMPSFPWVDHAWMTDLLIASFYSFSGTLGLGTPFSILVVSALTLSASWNKYDKNWLDFWWRFRLKQQDIWYFGTAPFLLSIAALLPFSGVRAQVITWLFFSFFLKIIFDENLWKKFRNGIPLLFLIWTNFHGGFTAGLSVFWLIILARFLLKKDWKKDLGLVLLSTVVTILNPYGFGVYREVWSSISDSSLRFEIIEWQPAFLSFDIPSISLVALSSLFVFIYRKKIGFEKAVLFFMLLMQGIASVRHFPLFVFVALPITNNAILYFFDSVKKDKISRYRFLKFYGYLWAYSVIFLVIQIFLALHGAFYLSEKNFYPQKAVGFLKEREVSSNIFSDYAWGGYLIWKYPQKRVFIDGRMPSWKWSDNPPGESGYIMKDYMDIIKGKKDHEETFQKFNVRLVMLPTEKPKSLFDALEKKYSDKFNSVYRFFGIEQVGFSLTDKLQNSGWKKVYEDKVAIILEKT